MMPEPLPQDDRAPPRMTPVHLRMRDAFPCSPALERHVLDVQAPIERFAADETLQEEGEPYQPPRFLVSGWAFRYVNLSDGRRQGVDLILPGDGIGITPRSGARAMTTIVAMTAVETVSGSGLVGPAALQACPEMVQVLQAVMDVAERRMIAQLVRLGRLSSLERVAHLVLTTHDRLALIGQATDGCFPFPVTQAVLAELLGLSVVHVNRTFQDLHSRKLVTLAGQIATIHDRAGLQALVPMSSQVPSA